MISTLLLMFALVLFILAGAWNTDPWRSRLVSFGLACWVAAELLKGIGPGAH